MRPLLRRSTVPAPIGSSLQCPAPHDRASEAGGARLRPILVVNPRTDTAFVRVRSRAARARSGDDDPAGPRDAAAGAPSGGDGPRSIAVERAVDRLVRLSRRSLDVVGRRNARRRLGRVGTAGRLPGNGREHRPGRAGARTDREREGQARSRPTRRRGRSRRRPRSSPSNSTTRPSREQDLAETAARRLSAVAKPNIWSQPSAIRYTW